MLSDILEEHLDEAVHLFGRRLLALNDLVLTTKDLLDLDERLRAHIDGLVVGREASWELCHGFLQRGSRAQSFVAASFALESGNPEYLAELESAMTTATGDVAGGIRWAGCLTPCPGARDFLERQLERPEEEPRVVALEALSCRDIDPGSALDHAFQRSEGRLLLAGLHAAGRTRAQRLLPMVEVQTRSEAPDICGAALESLVLLDPEQGRARCRATLDGQGPCPVEAAGLLAAVGQRGDLPSLARAVMSGNESLAREATLALASIGDPEIVPTLIGVLGIPELAGVVVVALRHMFGAHFNPEDSKTSQGDEEQGKPVERDVAWTPDDDLPRLSPEAVSQWWEDNRSRFPPGLRFRDGRQVQDAIAPDAPLGLLRWMTAVRPGAPLARPEGLW